MLTRIDRRNGNGNDERAFPVAEEERIMSAVKHAAISASRSTP